MAEAYHVPQQSRRDKLRYGHALYDPSLISADSAFLQSQRYNLSSELGGGEGVGFMNVNMMSASTSSSSSSVSHGLLDPQVVNPITLQYIDGSTGSPCVFNYYYKELLDQSFHGNGGQTLSLSLSSHDLPLELNLQSSVAGRAGNGCSTSVQTLSRSPLPLGPFTGYESVLKGSKFLKPAQQLLEEISDVGRETFADRTEDDNMPFLEHPLDSLIGNRVDGGGQARKKSRLISMLDEVYRRYRQYYQQMQAVFASFETVAGLSSAAPFANLALKALSKHFDYLKKAITDKLQFADKSQGKVMYEGEANLGVGAYGLVDQPVWRPQRGLPEHAVTILRAWLFEHFLHPYPTDTDKLVLAKRTGLSRNQVSNWFINARVRLWKPMVEEIHTLEIRQGQKAPQGEEQTVSMIDDDHPQMSSVECGNVSSFQNAGDLSSLKRTRNDSTRECSGTMGSPFNKLSQHPHLGVGVSSTGGCSGISLTLGLHQNSLGLSEHPINAARRLGLDGHGDGYDLIGFAAQNRQLGRDIIGGQLLHGFEESDH